MKDRVELRDMKDLTELRQRYVERSDRGHEVTDQAPEEKGTTERIEERKKEQADKERQRKAKQ